MKRLAFASAAATAILLVLGGTPAQAAQTRSLPAGNAYFAFDCPGGGSGVGEMATFDVLTSIGTIVGSNTPTPNTDCASQAAYDAVSDSIYWVSWGATETLMKADVTTGESVEVGPFSASGGANSIAIDDQGNAFAIVEADTDHPTPTGEKLYSLDLTTGDMTFIAGLGGGVGAYGSACVFSFAFNPKDKQFYINCDSLSYEISTVDVTNGDVALACDFSADPGTNVLGISFDTNGIGWTADGGYSNIASFDVTQASCGWEGGDTISVDGTGWYTVSNAITYSATPPPGPTPDNLPSTGASQGTAIASGVAAGVAFALAAGVFLMRRSLRKKS